MYFLSLVILTFIFYVHSKVVDCCIVRTVLCSLISCNYISIYSPKYVCSALQLFSVSCKYNIFITYTDSVDCVNPSRLVLIAIKVVTKFSNGAQNNETNIFSVHFCNRRSQGSTLPIAQDACQKYIEKHYHK